jgi:hypothetical protein
MAIAYLTNIDLSNNQLKGFKVDNQTSDPTGLAGEGQLIYRTDTNELKYHIGSNTWETITIAGGTVTSVDISSSTGTITVGGGPITNTGTLTVNLPVTGVTAGSYTSADITVDTYGRITAATSSGGGTMTSWKIGSTTGTDQTVIDGQTVDVVGGTYISGSVGGTRTVTLDHDATTRSDSTSTASSNSFAVVNSVTTNGTGHVTGIDVKTVTVPDNNTTSLPIKNSAGTVQFTSTDVTGLRFTASGAASVVFTPASQLITISSTDTNTTYTLPVSAGGSNSAVVTLDGSSGTDSTVTFEGTTDEIAVTETIVSGTEGTIKIGLPDDVTIANDLTVDGVIIQTEASSGSPAAPLNIFAGEVQVPTATAGGNAPNLAQVNLLISGVGVFQGAYNASTNSPALSGGSNVALNLGDYFVVSVAGNNGGYFPSLEPGDFIFADAAIGAGTSPAVSAYTVVQADANIAGSGTTDGNTNKGVSGFDSANFTVSSNGWVQLNDQSITVATYGSATKTVALAINADGITTTAAEQDIAIPASQITDFCAAVDTCVADNGVTANIGNGSATAYVINHLLGTRNVIVSCFRNSSPWDTVFMDVERTDTNNVTLRTTTALTTNEVSVIITKVT